MLRVVCFAGRSQEGFGRGYVELVWKVCMPFVGEVS